MKTKEECKTILFNLGIKLGVSPKLISERLLSLNDKGDMLAGFLLKEALECHIVAWMDSGMPDYANGKFVTMKKEIEFDLKAESKETQKLKYRPPFVRY